MKRISTFILALLLVIVADGVHGYEIVILQSSRAPHYEKSVEGFKGAAIRSVSGQGLKSARPDTATTYYLDGRMSGSELSRKILESDPDLILAVGNKALELAIGADGIPVIHLLAPAATRMAGERPRTTGVTMVIPPAKQLEAFKNRIPAIRKIGLIYDPGQSGEFVKAARRAALLKGIELVASKAGSSRQIPSLLAGMAGRVDAFWMLPDPTVTTPDTIEAMLHFSMDTRIPLLAFADKYVDMGATAAVSFDVFDMGRQAGEMARRVMADPGSLIPVEPPARLNLRINTRVAAKLGILVNTADARY